MPKGKARNPEITALMKKLNEKYKPAGAVKDVVSWGDEVPPIQYLPTASPALNYALGCGGWPEGKLIELIGGEGAGKTSLLNMAFVDHLKAHPNSLVGILDIEHRYNFEWAESLGVPLDRLVPMFPASAEDAADMMRDMIRSKQFSCVGFDSIGAVQPAAMQESFEEHQTRPGGAAAVMGRTVRMNAPDGNLFGCTVIYLNQRRADMSGRPGSQFNVVTPGGWAVKHGVSMRIFLRNGTKLVSDGVGADGKKAKIPVGFEMVFKVLKNSYGPPQREAMSNFYFSPSDEFQGIGFDADLDWRGLAVALGVVERGGGGNYSWRDIKGKGMIRFMMAVEEAGLGDDLRADITNRWSMGPQSVLPEGVESIEVTDDDV